MDSCLCIAIAGSGQTWLQHCRQEKEKGTHWLQAPHPQGGSYALVPAKGISEWLFSVTHFFTHEKLQNIFFVKQCVKNLQHHSYVYGNGRSCRLLFLWLLSMLVQLFFLSLSFSMMALSFRASRGPPLCL